MSYYETNNRAYVRGIIVSPPIFSHEVFGEGFYETEIRAPRLSNQDDVIPITISDRLLAEHPIEVGEELTFYGQFRSYNKLIGAKSKLVLTMFVREIVENDQSKYPNIIYLNGFICKPSIYRTTPFNREIADILLAVNRSYNKSDYIPCIAWGRNARFCKNFAVGEKIAVVGRIQSRVYVKKIDDTVQEQKTAFEISVSKISIGENIDKLEEEVSFYFPDQNENSFNVLNYPDDLTLTAE